MMVLFPLLLPLRAALLKVLVRTLPVAGSMVHRISATRVDEHKRSSRILRLCNSGKQAVPESRLVSFEKAGLPQTFDKTFYLAPLTDRNTEASNFFNCISRVKVN